MTEDKEVLKEYPLTRDFVDYNRLNLQHYLWKDIFGYNLHASVPRKGKNLKVADVGTGTGIWLFDISSEIDPSAELLGLDYDTSQTGPPGWLPSNVTTRVWDIFSDVPDDLVGKLDIVNIRLFGFVIRDDARPALQRLIKMLKPGGYLQWCEADVESWHIKATSPDVPTDKLAALWRQSVPEGSRLLPTWVKDLPTIFKAEGLVNVKDDWQTGSPHTTLAMHWCNLNLYQMIAIKLRRASKPEEALKIEELLEKALVQSSNGGMYAFKRVIVVGRKPRSRRQTACTYL